MKDAATVELFAAVKAGDAGRIESLLRDDPALANARDESGISALLTAIYYGRGDIADLLVARGADVDLFAAAALGRTERLEALLRANSALVHSYSPDGWTSLHLAAFFGHPDAVTVLLARGAGVRAVSRNSTGNTPFHSALAVTTPAWPPGRGAGSPSSCVPPGRTSTWRMPRGTLPCTWRPTTATRIWSRRSSPAASR